MENNRVELVGKIARLPEFDHEYYDENFYNMMISVERLSGVKDDIPVLLSEYLLSSDFKIGDRVDLVGQYRSYNKHEEKRNKLILNVFVTDIIKSELFDDENLVELHGYICKNPTFRLTPLGREITDLMVAVNRVNGKSDYIPCICWGRNAKHTRQYNIGDEVFIKGRIQSRSYIKNISEKEAELRVAYEVSVMNIVRDNNENNIISFAR